MSVTNVNLSMTNSSYGAYKQKLSEATKRKLEQYGIPYNSSTTESEAQQLIKQYEEMNSKSTSSQSSMFQNNENNDTQKQKLIALANQLGVQVDSSQSNEELESKIESKLEEKIKSSQNDKAELERLKELSYSLASIQSEKNNGSMGYDQSNQALTMSLEMLAQYNKQFLNQY